MPATKLSPPPQKRVAHQRGRSGIRRPDRRGLRRLGVLAAVLVLALGGGAFALLRGGGPDLPATVERFTAAWSRDDLGAMHALLTPESRKRTSLRRFTRAYEQAAQAATLQEVTLAGPVREVREGVIEAPLQARTKLFGTLSSRMRFTVQETEDGEARIRWARHYVFPGLKPGERLTRETVLADRADIEARDGTPIAAGPGRSGDVAQSILGQTGAIPAELAAEYAERGYPENAQVGINGLERALERRLAGTPGGVLKAGTRTLAGAEPRAAGPVRTSLDPDIQRAAVQALGDRLGAVAAVDPRTGEVLGMAGVAFSTPRAPGSTFKIVTLAGGLESGKVKPSDRFPAVTMTSLSGVPLKNAHGESCGGSLYTSFARSCNSVFAPMGAELGAQGLYDIAERFGFNEPPAIDGAAPSTVPEPEQIGDDLGAGTAAIGQGKVQATTLHMAMVAATIAADGRYTRPSLLKGGGGRTTRAVSERTARIIDRAMRRVVTSGTGVLARIEGVSVAG